MVGCPRAAGPSTWRGSPVRPAPRVVPVAARGVYFFTPSRMIEGMRGERPGRRQCELMYLCDECRSASRDATVECSACGAWTCGGCVRDHSCFQRSSRPRPEQQLAEWLAGRPSCPNSRGECCPDFSCCCPELLWPLAMRSRFVAAGDAERERMLVGSLDSMLARSLPRAKRCEDG